jgi:glycosyltransferase involved in cell wall biosynthesis
LTTKLRLIVIGPLPPPLHGVTISTALVLANSSLNEAFLVTHVNTSDHRSGNNVGRWDLKNVLVGLRNLVDLMRALAKSPGTVYLPISQSTGGFLRDSLFVWLATRKRWRVAIHLRGSEMIPFYRAQPRPYRWWIRTTLGRVASAAVVGESLRGVFEGLVPDERIAVVANGTPPIDLSTADSTSRQVLFLSNLRRRKGVIESVAAAHIVAQRVPDARFVFAGEWEDDELERTIRLRARALGERIEFRPTVSGRDKERLLTSSRLLLFPPREPEGHPRVVLEALAAGLPVVTTDRGAIGETVEDAVCGFVIPEPDPPMLADRIVRLLENDDLQNEMSRAALSRYHDHFTQARADHRLTEWLLAVALAAPAP